MTIEKVPGGTILRQEPRHVCPAPEPRRYNVGDRFVCDCGRTHVLMDAQGYQGGPYWTPMTNPAQAGDGGR